MMTDCDDCDDDDDDDDRRREGQREEEEWERGALSLQNEGPTPQDGWEKHVMAEEGQPFATVAAREVRTHHGSRGRPRRRDHNK